MKYILALALTIFSQLCSAFVLPLSECASLGNINTALVVTSSLCGHCKMYYPVYEAVSNNPKYSHWKFYRVDYRDYKRICERSINAVPYTFANHLKSVLEGAVDKATLEKFIDENEGK